MFLRITTTSLYSIGTFYIVLLFRLYRQLLYDIVRDQYFIKANPIVDELNFHRAALDFTEICF